MDEFVTWQGKALRGTRCAWVRVGWLLVLACARLALAADEPLPDPTQPAFAQEKNATGAETEPVPELQSILISPTRKLAVINGQTLHLGDKFGNAVLIRITEREVVLKNGRERQTLKLFPLVEKRKSTAASVASPSVKDR